MRGKKVFMLIAVTVVLSLSTFILSSCAMDGYMDPREDMVQDSIYYSAPADRAAGEYTEFGKDSGDLQLVGSTARYIIYNGSIDLTVRDTRDTMKKIRDIVEEAEGLVSNSSLYEIREGLFGANMTLRIPEKLFDDTIDQLSTLGKAANVNYGLEDITMEYIDLQSRLNNQKAQEARLVEILDMAETVEEVLDVERELSRVRGEIESMTARMIYLQDQVAYSTIYVTLREETVPTEAVSTGAFDNFGRRIKEAFIGSINLILNTVSLIVISISALLPVLLFLALIIIIIWVLVRKISTRRKKAETN